jgi:hypothetical protein
VINVIIAVLHALEIRFKIVLLVQMRLFLIEMIDRKLKDLKEHASVKSISFRVEIHRFVKNVIVNK